ncbi:MAG: hypothetical protein D6719_07655 [Candidatus Dadabacteria bacterium]|nr:MAG: hypothetical protein D6719_07655 [Candidatus Dadabacteria bacterium]
MTFQGVIKKLAENFLFLFVAAALPLKSASAVYKCPEGFVQEDGRTVVVSFNTFGLKETVYFGSSPDNSFRRTDFVIEDQAGGTLSSYFINTPGTEAHLFDYFRTWDTDKGELKMIEYPPGSGHFEPDSIFDLDISRYWPSDSNDVEIAVVGGYDPSLFDKSFVYVMAIWRDETAMVTKIVTDCLYDDKIPFFWDDYLWLLEDGLGIDLTALHKVEPTADQHNFYEYVDTLTFKFTLCSAPLVIKEIFPNCLGGSGTGPEINALGALLSLYDQLKAGVPLKDRRELLKQVKKEARSYLKLASKGSNNKQRRIVKKIKKFAAKGSSRRATKRTVKKYYKRVSKLLAALKGAASKLASI